MYGIWIQYATYQLGRIQKWGIDDGRLGFENGVKVGWCKLSRVDTTHNVLDDSSIWGTILVISRHRCLIT